LFVSFLFVLLCCGVFILFTVPDYSGLRLYLHLTGRR